MADDERTRLAAGSRRANRRAHELSRRREDAIAGASRVFAEKGFHHAQMTEIAAASELSRVSLYALFKGKEELYQEVVATAEQAIGDAVHEKVETIDAPRDQLLGVIDSLFACFDRHRDLLRIHARGTHGLPWKTREAIGESSVHGLHEFTAWVTEIAERSARDGYLPGLDPEAVGRCLVATISATALHWIETTPERPLSEATESVRAIFERLLEKRQ